MTPLYLCMLACYILLPLLLILNQGLFVALCGPLIVIALLCRRLMILEQQVAHLLSVQATREAVKHLGVKPMPSVPSVSRVKGIS